MPDRLQGLRERSQRRLTARRGLRPGERLWSPSRRRCRVRGRRPASPAESRCWISTAEDPVGCGCRTGPLWRAGVCKPLSCAGLVCAAGSWAVVELCPSRGAARQGRSHGVGLVSREVSGSGDDADRPDRPDRPDRQRVKGIGTRRVWEKQGSQGAGHSLSTLISTLLARPRCSPSPSVPPAQGHAHSSAALAVVLRVGTAVASDVQGI